MLTHRLFWIILSLLFVFSQMSTGEEEGKDEQKLNINEASAEELVELPGIGPAKAKAIIDFRDAHGPFEKASDLLHVRGIGEKTLANIADLITAEKKTEPARIVRRGNKLAIVWARIKAGRQ